MKIRILSWLFGDEKEKEKSMPDFKKLFASLPKTIVAGIIKKEDSDAFKKDQRARSDRTDAAKKISDKEAKTASDSYKAKGEDVYTRIQTARRGNYEIVWLLQTDKSIPYKSLNELVEGYNKVKSCKLYRGMSVNYIYEGQLREISPLNEQDLEGLAKKLESGKKVKSEAP